MELPRKIIKNSDFKPAKKLVYSLVLYEVIDQSLYVIIGGREALQDEMAKERLSRDFLNDKTSFNDNNIPSFQDRLIDSSGRMSIPYELRLLANCEGKTEVSIQMLDNKTLRITAL